MTDLTIVIASFETPALLEACLAAVERARADAQGRTIEVIVVDNGSRDASVEIAQRAPPPPRLVAFARNRGFAAAMNAGLRRAQGRCVLLLNSDVEIEAALVEGALTLLDAEPRIGVLGPALLHFDGRPQRSVHALPGLQTELFGDRGARRLRGEEREVFGRPQAWRDVEAVRGAVFFLRRAVFEEVGPLDEGFFFFLEETDYCARVRRAGHRVAYVPELAARHHLGASSKRRAPLATRIEYERSLDRYLGKHRGAPVAAIVRALRFVRRAGGVVIGIVPALVSKRARNRLAERIGVVLWHLRGRPGSPSLAEVLEERGPTASR